MSRNFVRVRFNLLSAIKPVVSNILFLRKRKIGRAVPLPIFRFASTRTYRLPDRANDKETVLSLPFAAPSVDVYYSREKDGIIPGCADPVQTRNLKCSVLSLPLFIWLVLRGNAEGGGRDGMSRKSIIFK